LGYPVAEEDRAFLRRAWQESAGFVTYCEGPGAWSEPHLDILWPAFRGAQLDSPQQCWQSLQSKLDADFDVGSGWHGYWWKGPWYCTYHVLLAAHWLDDKSRFCFTPESGPLSTDSFSSAGWIAGSLLLSGHTNAGLALFNQIADSQRADGSWDSSADLRVTNPEVSVPDESPLSGQLYADQNRLMTTASVLRALCTEPCKAELAKV
jgi:hypothetical protein